MRYRKILADKLGIHLDPESLIYLEAGVRRKTFRAIPTSDRVIIAGAVDRLEEKAGIGDDAALQIIMHLGILFSAANYKSAVRPKTDDDDQPS